MELSEFDKLAEKTVNKYIRESGMRINESLVQAAERAALAGEAKLLKELKTKLYDEPTGLNAATMVSMIRGYPASSSSEVATIGGTGTYCLPLGGTSTVHAPSFTIEYPATPQEAFVKEGSRDMYFTYKGRIVECEVPKKWMEVGYGPAYPVGFEDGLEGSSGDEVASFSKRLEAEAYLEGFKAGVAARMNMDCTVGTASA